MEISAFLLFLPSIDVKPQNFNTMFEAPIEFGANLFLWIVAFLIGTGLAVGLLDFKGSAKKNAEEGNEE